MKASNILKSCLVALVIAVVSANCTREGQIGPQGEQGDAGFGGDKGPKGDRGETGARGEPKPKGPVGLVNVTYSDWISTICLRGIILYSLIEPCVSLITAHDLS